MCTGGVAELSCHFVIRIYVFLMVKCGYDQMGNWGRVCTVCRELWKPNDREETEGQAYTYTQFDNDCLFEGKPSLMGTAH